MVLVQRPPTPVLSGSASAREAHAAPAVAPVRPEAPPREVSREARGLAIKNQGHASSPTHGAKPLPASSPLFLGVASGETGAQAAAGGGGGGKRPPGGPGREPPPDKVSLPPSADELRAAHQREAARLQAERVQWTRGLFGVSSSEAITTELAARGWSPVKFENLVSYGSADQVRELLRYDGRHRDARASDAAVLDTPLPAAICGQTANQLARCVLGRARGDDLVQGLNGALRAQPIAPPQGVTTGVGLDALARALSEQPHAMCLLQLGPNHRLILERRPDDTVTVLQGWIDQFSLAQWMDVGAGRNGAKITRPMDEAFQLLTTAITDRDTPRRIAANRALFEPPGMQLRDNLDRDVRVTFSVVPVEPRSVHQNVRAFFDDPGSIIR